MAEKIKEHDFIELDYTGMLSDKKVFDTTVEEKAKESHLFSPEMKYQPTIICVGEGQLVPGLDKALVDKEVGQEYTITLKPEEGFGKRDIKKIKLIPYSEFQKKNIDPKPGMQIDMDGEMGIVSRSSGGRVMVNFNHPFAGKELIYEIKINKKVTNKAEQIKSYLKLSLNFPGVKAEVTENKAIVTLPVELPDPILEPLSKKLKEITHLKEITFKSEKQETTPNQ